MMTKNKFPTINDTTSYHRNTMETLGWELTVCNMLADPLSPARTVLKNDFPYGVQLFYFLSSQIAFSTVSRIWEVGGGYGFLMRDFLKMLPPKKVTMLDISPLLLAQQKEALVGHPDITYIEEDFLAYNFGNEERIPDLIILNENLGDFPTVVNMDHTIIVGNHDHDWLLREARRILHKYEFLFPEGSFNFNIGAILAVEKICSLSIPYVFIAEHSCEANIPTEYSQYAKISAGGYPQKISLYGHDEYTIKFSYLSRVARDFGYGIKRGSLVDILPFNDSSLLRTTLELPPLNDADEIIQHFFADLFQYEYILLTKNP